MVHATIIAWQIEMMAHASHLMSAVSVEGLELLMEHAIAQEISLTVAGSAEALPLPMSAVNATQTRQITARRTALGYGVALLQ